MVFGYEDYVSKRMRMDKFSEDLIKLFFYRSFMFEVYMIILWREI